MSPKKSCIIAFCVLFSSLVSAGIKPVIEINGSQAGADFSTTLINGRKVLNFSGDHTKRISRSAQVSTEENFTLYAWVKPEKRAETGVAAIISRPGRHIKLAYTSQGIFRFTVWSLDNTKYFVENKIPQDTTDWIQVAGVYDRKAKYLSLFINGRLAEKTPMTEKIAPNQSAFWFGSATTPSAKYSFLYQGQADRLRIYQGAASADEIAELYRTEAPDYGISLAKLQANASKPLPNGKISFHNKDFFSINYNVAQVSNEGMTLHFGNKKPYSSLPLFHIRPGYLKQNTIYTITFHYQLDPKSPANAFLNFYSKSYTAPHIHPLLKFNANSREKTERKVLLITRDEADQYFFAADLYNSAAGEISDFTIQESAVADGSLPLVAGSMQTPLPPLPTGCPEFEVKLPDGKGEKIHAADFGMSTAAADNTAALQKLLDYCRERKPAQVIFSRGTYRLGGSVKIEHLENLDIDGNGAFFLYYRDLKGAKENFAFRNCRQVRIRNLNFDWDWDKMPLGSLVEVINVNGDEIDFRFCDYDYFPKRDLRVAMVSEMDPKTRLVTVENKAVFHFEFYLGQYVPETKWLSGNVLRVKDRGNNWNREHLYYFHKGQFFRMLHAYYDGGMFLAENCTDFTFENLNIYSTTGKNFHFRGMKNWQLRRVRCAPPAGRPERVVSSTADGYGHERCYGNFKMEDCVFACGNDDFLNLQDNSIYVRRFSENSLATINLKGPLPSTGDTLELREADYSILNFKAKVIKTGEIGAERIAEGLPWGDQTKKIYEIILDRPLPRTADGTFIAFNLKFNSGNAIFRRCRFENTDGSGRFQASNITIENCIFRNNASASIHLATGYTLRAWNEGYGINNLVVRNCLFDCAAGGVRNIGAPEADCFFNLYTAKGPARQSTSPVFQNILFENNTFRNSTGMIASITHGSNIIFKNNRFASMPERKRQMSYRGGVQIFNSNHIYFINNQFHRLKTLPLPTVFFDKGTVSDLVVYGNSFEPQQP